MEAQLAQFGNRGMNQTLSISKETNEYAFKNYNIRINAINDNTALSITNEKGPSLQYAEVKGNYIGHCILGDYFILFTLNNSNTVIYRINIDNDNIICKEIYKGNLNMSNNIIETIGYYESQDVQKVYWLDGKNSPRYINIMDESLINKTNVNFDFQPVVNSNLKVEITKDYNGVGLFPSGVIQYFISYYNKYGAESSIVYASPLNYISFKDRGGSPEDIITCSFNLKISNLDKNFTHIRVYSCKRTSYNGIPEAKIVTDVNIEGKDEITVIDTNTNQPLTDYTYLFFIGGKDFIASTFTQKDDTLFFGNIELKNVVISAELKEIIRNTIIEQPTGFMESSIISFNYKNVPYDKPEGYYPYTPQTKNDSTVFKTFKNGEIYRFAIQFQTNKGQWTTPVWIGDKRCELPPIVEEGNIKLANACCNVSSISLGIHNSGFVRFRILYAETNSSNRSILAQGVVNPTMFNYGERYENKPFAISSWFMRPRGGNISWRHLESTNSNVDNSCEIQSVYEIYPPIYNKLNDYTYHVISIMHALQDAHGQNGFTRIHEGITKLSKDDKITKEDIDYAPIGDSGKRIDESYYQYLTRTFSSLGEKISNYLTEDEFNKILNNCSLEGIDNQNLYSGGYYDTTQNHNYPASVMYYMLIPYKDVNNDIIDKNIKNQYYYVDNSILTFHSPELEENQDLINDSNLKFRIIGISELTSSYSDADFSLNTTGLSENSEKIIDIENFKNLSTDAFTLLKVYFKDYYWQKVSTNDNAEVYLPEEQYAYHNVYVWNKSKSLIGQNNKTFKDLDNEDFIEFDNTVADLKDKIFATQKFCYNNTYFNIDNIKSYNDINPKIFAGNNLEILKLDNDKFYSGNYDKLLTFDKPYKLPIKSYDEILLMLDSYDPIRIKYKSTPHAVFSLNSYILPRLQNEKEFNLKNYYTSTDIPDDIKYPWFEYKVDDNIVCYGVIYCDIKDNHSIQELYNKCEDLIENNRLKMTNDLKANKHIICIISNNSSDYTDVHSLVQFKKDYENLLENPIRFTVSPVRSILPPFLQNSVFNIDLYNLTTDYTIEYDSYKFSNSKLIPVKQVESYKELVINHTCEYPYLYLGELYRDIPYETLYGGLDDNNLEQLTWIPCSKASSFIRNQTVDCEGDTYFQRWDCLKTYPFTEDDINKVVDITSFMVETHINLDGRYDRNRGVGNLLNVRPDNFGLRNNVYSQPNNLFTYNVLDEKFDNTKYGNQIMWSLQKNPTSDIDGWTSISTSNVLNLNGLYGDVTKLITSNDRIYSFQPKSINIINFNSKVVLQTDNNVPVEIANSAKVDGYVTVTNNNGCKNKNSIVSTQSGIYFIDDYNKSLLRINNEGLNNVSQNMSIWFKDNLTEEEFLFYDSLNNDIYLINKDNCLIYNEALQSFTSFMDYQNMQTLFNLNGKTYAMHNDKLYKMFEGEYNSTFTDLRYNGYSMEYRINPSAHTDNIFTNVEFYADLMLPYNKVSDKDITVKLDAPFNKLEVWNEYQKGETNITERYKYPNAEKKFRMWRLDIPRDSKNKLDRMRNPWIHLKLSNDTFNSDRSMRTTNDLKMIFHNLVVKYYK